MKRIGEILKLNGFYWEGNSWNRDDGFQIIKTKYEFMIVNGFGDTYDCKNDYECIGFLSVKGIINRLF